MNAPSEVSRKMKVAVVGYGYWGKNIARVFSQDPRFDLRVICDGSPLSLAKAKITHPYVEQVGHVDDIPKDIEVVAIITPTASHFELAKMFLERGCNVLLTKPFTRVYSEAEQLVEISRKTGSTIFVDHTFVFNSAVRTLKKMLHKVGQPYFVLSQRLNLGLYQPDVNVVYDLMPHDMSIINYLFETAVKSATTSSFRAAGLPQEDIAHCSFELESGLKGLVTVSWLSPYKLRQFFIVGSDGMLAYDEMAVSEKIKFYDRGISLQDLQNPNSDMAYTSRISYRSGDMFSPGIKEVEALSFEMGEFYAAIHNQDVRETYNRLNLSIMKSLDIVLRGEANRSATAASPS